MAQLSLHEAYVTEAENGCAIKIKIVDGEEYPVLANGGVTPYLEEGHQVDVIPDGGGVRILGAMAPSDGACLLPVSYRDGDATVCIPDRINTFKMGFPRGRIEMTEDRVDISAGTISNN